MRQCKASITFGAHTVFCVLESGHKEPCRVDLDSVFGSLLDLREERVVLPEFRLSQTEPA